MTGWEPAESSKRVKGVSMKPGLTWRPGGHTYDWCVLSSSSVSSQEDGLVVAALWLAVTHPLVFGIALLVAVLLMAVLTVILFKFLRAAWRRLETFLSGSQKAV